MLLVRDIVMPKSECLGLFTVKDFIRLSGVSTKLQTLVVKHKVVK